MLSLLLLISHFYGDQMFIAQGLTERRCNQINVQKNSPSKHRDSLRWTGNFMNISHKIGMAENGEHGDQKPA